MAKYVLVSDTTLSHDYKNFPLLDFLPSAPTELLPEFIYKYLKGKPPPDINGRASVATYPLRKLEAGLLQKHKTEEVVVAHEDHIEDFIGDDTEIIGVTTMDPFGLAPLTMSYILFFGLTGQAYVQKEFATLLKRINHARAGKKAKLVVGGPGVWELTVHPEEMDKNRIDYAFQGESDDIIDDLFNFIIDDQSHSNEFFRGFQTFDSTYHKSWIGDPRFISRYQFSKQFPRLEEIPEIVGPTIKGFIESMRGCGVGCDFCEVTLRPLRYYSPEKVRKEIAVNVKAGIDNVWLHSDEIFAYKHGRNYVPDADALSELFTAIITAPGVAHTNPTHGRISIPAAYPELIKKLSEIIKAGPENWIGLQVGVETGSDKLAKIHMPNKTMPLKVGPDGSWAEIVWRGTYVMNKYYWRPAFTVQVGQESETDEDNWDTVALINQMSNSVLDDGRPFEFTITPMQNVSLGHLKNRNFSTFQLSESQLAVYYASYKHLAKVAARDAFRNGRNGRNRSVFNLFGTGTLISLGGRAMLRTIAHTCRRQGLDVEKAAKYGLDQKTPQAPMIPAMQV
ncbi:MAG: B12-binding domain-containing radical SAM protein [Nitrososphaerota archaeon]|nr:B12-binding domain-containing radical SAM protein [Nitrososphaerota archaeon]MDG6924340.1 B12-binding domain-containing radical SAM protein [Nitrososphaerota archaeon]